MSASLFTRVLITDESPQRLWIEIGETVLTKGLLDSEKEM